MDTVQTKDVRGFVDDVVGSLRGDNRAKKDVPKIQAFLHRVTQQTRKEKIATVETSISLTAKEKEDIEHLLRTLLGRDIEVNPVVRPEVLGGVRIQVGDWVVDTTLLGQLTEMRNDLVQS